MRKNKFKKVCGNVLTYYTQACNIKVSSRRGRKQNKVRC
nr:MAG TPA: hypothetical protein [Caudoviricetes sp.]